ncbi:MAG: hypothetical protein GY710_24910 [Desulfobacteraceae bacterium]|nr:hypothetical protein [Desulfobacteraceae bacterium]
MRYDTLTSAWLEIGSRYKENLEKNEDTKRSKNFQQLRLSEKKWVDLKYTISEKNKSYHKQQP